MELFPKLAKYRRKDGFESSSEMRFFLENADILNSFPLYRKFRKAYSSFDVIRANLLLRALSNKMVIEKGYYAAKKEEVIPGTPADPNSAAIKAKLESLKRDLPYYQLNEQRIYVPVLPLSFNLIYDQEPTRLDEHPYSSLAKDYEAALIDPFDYYGPDLFDSYFTRLVKVGQKGRNRAFLNYDSFSLYFVNEQGRLDVECVLFDKFLDHPSYNHLLARVKPAVEAYYKDNKDEFIQALVDNRLISSSFAFKIKNDEQRFYANIAKRYSLDGTQ